jgi:hypothetical protein
VGYVVDDSCEPSSSSGTLSVGFHIIFLFVKAVNLLQQQAYQRALLQQRADGQAAAPVLVFISFHELRQLSFMIISVGFHAMFLFVKEAYQRALLQQRAIGQAAAERRATEAQVYLYQWMILHVNV